MSEILEMETNIRTEPTFYCEGINDDGDPIIYLINEKFDKSKETEFDEDELCKIFSDYQLFCSVSSSEFSFQLITDLLEFYNIESEKYLLKQFNSLNQCFKGTYPYSHSQW